MKEALSRYLSRVINRGPQSSIENKEKTPIPPLSDSELKMLAFYEEQRRLSEIFSEVEDEEDIFTILPDDY